MSVVHNRLTGIILRLYVAAVLIAAAVVSPLALSFIPVLVLIWYLYLLRWPINSVIVLITHVFIYFAAGLLFMSRLGPFLPLPVSLPVILLIYLDLEATATTFVYVETAKENSRRPTGVYITLISGVAAALGLSLLTGNLILLLSSAVMAAFFGILGVISLRRMPGRPVTTGQARHQMVAGSTEDVHTILSIDTRIGGLLFLKSFSDRMKVEPDVVLAQPGRMRMKLTLTPELSGPSTLKIRGQMLDRWGLFRTSFELDAVELFVIPRARYAAWLAERYMAGTTQGDLPLISNLEARRPHYGLRQGIEYYGSKLYQPGDSQKNIDWKHSVKYNEMITKEYVEFSGQSAVILINLSVADEKEADILAYNIIVTALSLAREEIPAALAIYSHEGVKMTTITLRDRQLVARSLRIAREMVTYVNPVRYLNPPDITRLRANISRIRRSENRAAQSLLNLMQLEYKSLNENADRNPATLALREVMAKAEIRSNIVIISMRNHDAEALAFNEMRYALKGNAIITI
jgi:hypothetical protein